MGKAGAVLPSGASTFVHFSTYARENLKTTGTGDMRILSVLADML